MIIFEANKRTMKRLFITLAAVATLASCVEAPETNVVEHGEGYTLERLPLPKPYIDKDVDLVRGCCTLYNYNGHDSILCTTNNGRCGWCYALCEKWGKE